MLRPLLALNTRPPNVYLIARHNLIILIISAPQSHFPLPIERSPPLPLARPFGSASVRSIMRKRSMSIFAEPISVEDDEDNQDDASDTEPTTTAGAAGAGVADGAWTADEKHTLIATIEEQLPRDDNQSYTRRLKTLDWNCVQLPGRTERDCKEQLMLLLKKLRHVRSLSELCGDVHRYIDNPPQSAAQNSAYHFFCADYRKANPGQGKGTFSEWGAAFRALTPEQRQKYDEMAAAARKGDEPKRLQRELEAATATPFILFCRAELERTGTLNKVALRQEFGKLSDEERMPWIRAALAQAQQDGVESFQVLSTKELKLVKNKPKQMTGYTLFIKEQYASVEGGRGNQSLADVSRMYKELSAAQKLIYKKRAAAVVKEEGKAAGDAAKPAKKAPAQAFLSVQLAAETPPAKKLKQTKLVSDAGGEAANAEEKLLTPLKRQPAPYAQLDETDAFLRSPPPRQPGELSSRKRKSNGETPVVDTLSPSANSTRRSIKMESSSETETTSSAKKRRKNAARDDDEDTKPGGVVVQEPQRAPK